MQGQQNHQNIHFAFRLDFIHFVHRVQIQGNYRRVLTPHNAHVFSLIQRWRINESYCCTVLYSNHFILSIAPVLYTADPTATADTGHGAESALA